MRSSVVRVWISSVVAAVMFCSGVAGPVTARAESTPAPAPAPVSTPRWITAAPAVTAVSPTRGPASGKTLVTVTGTGFSKATKVLFGDKAGRRLRVLSDTSLTVLAPPGRGKVDVRVVTRAGTSRATVPNKYRYIEAPWIAVLRPGSAGTDDRPTITIRGTGFVDVSEVLFGDVAGSDVRVLSENKLTVTAPAHQAGSTHVRVVTAYGSSKKGWATRLSFVAPPEVSSVRPASGPAEGGTKVTIKGSGFRKATQVTFGDTPATKLRVLSDRKLTVIAPGGTAGSTVGVSVTGTYGASAPGPDARYSYESTCAPTVIPVSGNITTDTIWQPGECGTVYRVSGTVTIDEGVALTVEPNTIVKFEADAALSVDGSLIVDDATFTSIHDDTVGGDTNGNGDQTKPEPGSWAGISVVTDMPSDEPETYVSAATFTANRLDLRYGAGITADRAGSFHLSNSTLRDNSAGVGASRSQIPGWVNPGAITITDNTLIRSGGISVRSDPFTSPVGGYAGEITVTGNNVTGNTTETPAYSYSDEEFNPADLASNTGSNNTVNAIYISGTVSSWTVPSTGLPFVVAGRTIQRGTLTVPAGSFLKLAGSLEIGAGGSLVVNGTADNPAIMTSIHDDTVGGDTNGNGNATSPAAGGWRLEVTGYFDGGRGGGGYGNASVEINGLSMRYGYGITSLPGYNTTIRITNSHLVDHSPVYGDSGIFVVRGGPGSTTITGNTLTRSGTVQVVTDVDEQHAGPLEVSGNTINP